MEALRTSKDYFSSDALRADLKGRTVRGGAITAAAQVANIFISLAAISVLARLIDPADFGLIGMVTVLTNFAAMFVDSGLSMATVQREKITSQQVSNLFWIASGLGAVIALIVACLAPFVAWFYGEPRLTAITLALSVSFLFSGFTLQHQALLRRNMQFVALSTITIVAILIGQLAGIAWAWQFYKSEYDYWALVLIPITTAGVRLMGTWLACRWQPGWPTARVGTRGLVEFGANLTGFNFVNYFARNADNLLIGWYYGPVALGFYDRAYKLLSIPLRQINGPITGVAIPALSRVIEDPAKYRRFFLRLLQLVLIITMPLAAFLFSTRDWCVDLLLGPKWAAAVPIFAWLSLAAFLQPFSQVTGWLFLSQGRGREMFHWGIVGGSTAVASFLVGLPWGPVGVAACYSISGLLVRMPILTFWTTRRGPVGMGDVLRVMPLPLGVGGAVFLSLSLLRQIVTIESSIMGILAAMVIALTAWLAVLFSTTAGRNTLSFLGDSIAGLRPQNN